MMQSAASTMDTIAGRRHVLVAGESPPYVSDFGGINGRNGKMAEEKVHVQSLVVYWTLGPPGTRSSHIDDNQEWPNSCHLWL